MSEVTLEKLTELCMEDDFLIYFCDQCEIDQKAFNMMMYTYMRFGKSYLEALYAICGVLKKDSPTLIAERYLAVQEVSSNENKI